MQRWDIIDFTSHNQYCIIKGYEPKGWCLKTKKRINDYPFLIIFQSNLTNFELQIISILLFWKCQSSSTVRAEPTRKRIGTLWQGKLKTTFVRRQRKHLALPRDIREPHRKHRIDRYYDVYHSWWYQGSNDSFGEIPNNFINAERSVTNDFPDNDADATTKCLQQKLRYTYLFVSIDKDYKNFLTHKVSNHHRQGQLAWKFITEHSIKNDNQAIRRAICKMHIMNLEQFDFSVDKLVTIIIKNKRILASCGETDHSITANLFRILKDELCDEFNGWVFSKQTIWDEGGTFDLENLIKNCKKKCHNYVTDSLWKKNQNSKDLANSSDIVAITSKIDKLDQLLLLKKSNNNGGNNGPSKGWKNEPPEK